MKISKNFVSQIKTLIHAAQQNAVRAINQERVLLYWNIGKHIIEEKQHGQERAAYGTFLIKTLAQELTTDFGSGFSERQLETCRQFYQHFPIAHTLRAELSWSHYKLLIRNENQPDENPSIVILLCADKNETMVKFALPENQNTILASKYERYLPSEEELKKELKFRKS